jgi:uncharacterized repeat protein (TIGR03837 family)
MPNTSSRPDWDIFCQVIDNFGDIGVCWRLARQLRSERQLRVRLWVDELEVFRALRPEVDPGLSMQELQGVEIRRWETPFVTPLPAHAVLETFACRIPEAFIAAMAQQSPRPVWINLDYLSAEAWVPGFHTLPSPHPRLPLNKFFFFPGFSRRYRRPAARARPAGSPQQFAASAEQQAALWRQTGGAPPPVGSLLVSLFAYENPAIKDLLRALARGADGLSAAWYHYRARCRPSKATPDSHSRPATLLRRGALEIRILPFLEQDLYDRLLWLCDLNFVRGEDSFLRAQWAARPMVWHIYPQQDGGAHRQARRFPGLYCATCRQRAPAQCANSGMHGARGGRRRPLAGASRLVCRRLREHARRWQETRQNRMICSLVCCALPVPVYNFGFPPTVFWNVQ